MFFNTDWIDVIVFLDIFARSRFDACEMSWKRSKRHALESRRGVWMVAQVDGFIGSRVGVEGETLEGLLQYNTGILHSVSTFMEQRVCQIFSISM